MALTFFFFLLFFSFHSHFWLHCYFAPFVRNTNLPTSQWLNFTTNLETTAIHSSNAWSHTFHSFNTFNDQHILYVCIYIVDGYRCHWSGFGFLARCLTMSFVCMCLLFIKRQPFNSIGFYYDNATDHTTIIVYVCSNFRWPFFVPFTYFRMKWNNSASRLRLNPLAAGSALLSVSASNALINGFASSDNNTSGIGSSTSSFIKWQNTNTTQLQQR